MNRNTIKVGLFYLGALGLMAQPPHGGETMRHPGGPGGPGGPPPGFARDMKVVKGQPYAADMVNESTQILGDGTRISSKISGSVYRDTDGRTRREEANAQGHKSITIFDPVAAVSMSLNASSKTASKAAVHVPTADHALAGHRGPGSGAPAGDHAVRAGRPNQNRVVEDLGNQAVEGVAAQGKRTTTTIAAGTMGNDRDIKIVDEVWFSPDLQVVVQSRHSDPRTGEVTYKLANIRRADQAHTLFEVPADYQVKEAGNGFRRQGPPPAARQ